MKTIKFTIIAFIAVLSLASCKKDPVEKTTAEKIMGKWNYISSEVFEGSAPSADDIEKQEPGNYADFRSDGILYMNLKKGRVEEYPYTVDSDTQITIDGTAAKILVLTDHKFSFESRTENSGITTTFRYNLTR